jgi:hypothetical protein
MAAIWALLLIGCIMLPCATGLVEAIDYNIFHRHASRSEILIVWAPSTLLFWTSIFIG